MTYDSATTFFNLYGKDRNICRKLRKYVIFFLIIVILSQNKAFIRGKIAAKNKSLFEGGPEFGTENGIGQS